MTYDIVRAGNCVGILCLICGLTSWNPRDVEQHFCVRCGLFHDDSLYLFGKDEWWSVAKIARPSLTYDEFEVMWEEFTKRKREGAFDGPRH